MPNWLDVVNGLFELCGAAATWANVRRLRRDKAVRGVDWRAMVFFWAWGAWNLFYYPSLQQWFSFIGGLALVAGNTAWVLMYFVYRKRK